MASTAVRERVRMQWSLLLWIRELEWSGVDCCGRWGSVVWCCKDDS